MELTNNKKKIYTGIAFGFLFLFVVSAITFFALLGLKEDPLFENMAVPSVLGISFVLLGTGSFIAIILALRKKNDK